MTSALMLDLPSFSIEHVTMAEGIIVVLVQSQTTSSSCPDCAQTSSRIHSRYRRTLTDLPCSGHMVRLVLQVSRFFCSHPECSRKTFAEPIPDLAERFARRTTRLKEVLERIALALGGEPASRLTTVLAMECSPDTLLRLLRRLPDEPIDPPRVVSLDDWAWRRGARYGTIICDLERRRRLDVLPDRDAASAAAWLKRYPSIEIISRDRAGEYAEAARVGAPQAVQVADRFHLSQNLHEAVDQAVRRCYPTIQQLLSPAQPVVLGEDLPLKRDDAAKAATQQRRMARYERVKVLHEQGYSLAQIAAYLGMKQETVQKYLMEPPRPSVYKPRHGKLTKYKPFLHRRFFQEGCRNSLLMSGYPLDSFETFKRSEWISLIMPDREAETVVTWLKTHPGVKIISRDRAGTYADGARRGAPKAIQVADRFHLLLNLTTALQKLFERKQDSLQRLAADEKAARLSAPMHEAAANSPVPVADPLTATETQRQGRRARRKHRYEEAIALHQQGASQVAIAALLGLHRDTVRRYINAADFPEIVRPRKRSKLDPYKAYLQERWNAGQHNIKQLVAELRERGYRQGETIVYDYLRSIRGRARITAKIYHKPIGSRYKPIYAMRAKVTLRSIYADTNS
jgi:transposase